MDLRDAFGGKFAAAEGKRKDRTRIKNLEPETRPEPVTEPRPARESRAPQGTNLRPSDVNPRPSSVPRGPISSFPTLGQVLGNAAKSTLGTIGSLGNTGDPGIYLIQISVDRNDCHMICVFLLVFILSFLLSNRKV